MAERIASDVRLVRHEVDARDHAARDRGVVGDTRVDDGDADADTGHAGLTEETKQGALPAPDSFGSRHLVDDRRVGDDWKVARQMRDAAVGDEALQLGRAQVERQGPGELTPEPPAQAKTECGERVLLPLHDDARTNSACESRFQIVGKRRTALPLGMSRGQHETEKQNNTQHPTHRCTSWYDTSTRVRTRGSGD